ncbi:MAG: tetratricopeptide repeat protein [Cyanobacteria bacterium P01_H01_bin.35]
MAYNLQIPGKFIERELWAIEEIAKLVPPGGIVVEVGSSLGLSSYTWAKSVDTSVTVYCIDVWENDAEYAKKLREKYQTDYSLENFRNFTERCPNIVTLPGFSPQDFAEWDKSIDVYCQNIDSQNTIIQDNISFWSQFVKPGGIICGFGYGEEFPDVKNKVDNLSQFYHVQPVIVEKFWCLVSDGNFERLNGVAKVKEIHGYEYELEIYEPPAILAPGDILQVSGKLKNLSGRDWNLFVDDVEIIKIGIQIYEENKTGHQEFRQTIGDDKLIDAGNVEFDFVLDTNQLQQGKIRLEFDVLAEFLYWFKDKGAKSKTVEVQILPIIAGNLNKVGNQLKRKGKLTEAIGEYRQAIELNPDFSWSYYNLGDALAKKGHIKEAIARYKKAIELNPKSALFNYQLSELLAQQKCDDEAVYFWQKADKFGFNKQFNQSIKSILAQRKSPESEKQDNSSLFNDISLYLSDLELERVQKYKQSKFPKKYIFITARYRTGSTYLHSLFSSICNIATFYEPLNEDIIRWLDSTDDASEKDKYVNSHTFKGNYFEEYKLLDRDILQKEHTVNFAKYKVIMSSLESFPKLKRYIKFLLASHTDAKKSTVLQFNKIDFRLAWFKVNFPNAIIVNLRRNSRDIYVSYIGVYEKATSTKINPLTTDLGVLVYLNNYINFLGDMTSYKFTKDDFNNYEKIYLTNQLSNVWADKFADIIIDYESLVENPVDILGKILAHIPNFNLEFTEEIIPPRKDRINIWHNYHSEDWFQKCEEKCDHIFKQILSLQPTQNIEINNKLSRNTWLK